MQLRLFLFLGLFALVCVAVRAEDPQAEPEAAAEPEPSAEPEHAHHDGEHSGSTKSETKGKLSIHFIPSFMNTNVTVIYFFHYLQRPRTLPELHSP